MAQSLEDQLAEVFARGLDSDPELRASLEEALSSSSETKATKAEANYRKADSEADRCGTCKHFNGDSRCNVVSGVVSPDGLSDFYEPLDKEKDAGE